MLTDDQIRAVLERARTVAVVGLSDRATRPSYSVASYLATQGYRIIPINPTLTANVFGVRPLASLRDTTEHVDIAVIFRRPEFVLPIVEDAIAISADVVWMQLGVANAAAVARAAAAGLEVIGERCMAIEHRRLIG